MGQAARYVLIGVAALTLWPLLLVNLLLIPVVPAVALAYGVSSFGVRTYVITSSAMEPTLHCARPAPGCEAESADRVIVNRFVYRFREPQRGDLVVFEVPSAARAKCGAGGTFVKRIVGLPGERVGIRLRRGAAYVHIDGRQLEEPYVQDERRDFGPEETFRVPQGHYFVMGDNRAQSCDSRVWGSLPDANLIGKVFFTYWPVDRMSDQYSSQGRYGLRVQLSSATMLRPFRPFPLR